MKITHIIWDWNGTLVNDAVLCVEIVNELLNKYSLNEVSLEYYRNNFRFPVSSYYEMLGLPYEGTEYEKIAEMFISRYREKSYACKLQPFAKETLERISDLNISQSVLTAGNINDLQNYISFYGLEKIFRYLDGVSNIYAKGKLELSDFHFKKLNKKKEEVLLIGDTQHDYEIACKLGIPCILYTNGHSSSSVLNSFTAEITSDLRSVLKGLSVDPPNP